MSDVEKFKKMLNEEMIIWETGDFGEITFWNGDQKIGEYESWEAASTDGAFDFVREANER